MPEENDDGVEFTYAGKRYRRVKPASMMWCYRSYRCRRCFLAAPFCTYLPLVAEASARRDLLRRRELCSNLRNRIAPNGAVSVKIPSCQEGRYLYEEVSTEPGVTSSDQQT